MTSTRCTIAFTNDELVARAHDHRRHKVSYDHDRVQHNDLAQAAHDVERLHHAERDAPGTMKCVMRLTKLHHVDRDQAATAPKTPPVPATRNRGWTNTG